MPLRPLKEKDKYYPGSPWGDKPPEEVALATRARADHLGVQVNGQVDIPGMHGPILTGETAAGDVLMLNKDACRHVDAYLEYRQLVGDTDGGRLLPEAEYEALRERAADPSRRVWAHWVENSSGLECKAMGPSSKCFCGHLYREHSWDEYPETQRLSCKMRGCSCAEFHYVPVKGSGDLRCSGCRQSYLDHDPRTRKCKKAGKSSVFMSSWSCACRRTYDEHSTIVQTNAEREASGKLTNAPWMEAATRSGLPTAHMGGIGGFTSLADGVDRAMAGLEPGFEPEIIGESWSSNLDFEPGPNRPASRGTKPSSSQQNRTTTDRFVPRGPIARAPLGQGARGSATTTRSIPKARSMAQRPEWQD